MCENKLVWGKERKKIKDGGLRKVSLGTNPELL